MATVGIALSGTPLADEYRALCGALGQPLPDPTLLDAGQYAAEAVTQAVAFWRQRMHAEHRSVAVFLQLGAQLIEANAPLDATTLMLRLAQDELRHTEICGLMLRGLGAVPEVSADLTVQPLARHQGCDPQERALRNVIYACCLSEMVAVAGLVDALEAARDPVARTAIRAIVADEVLHGRFGFFYLEAVTPWLDEAPGRRAEIAAYLRHAFVVLERTLAGGGQGPAVHPDAALLGVTSPDRLRELFHAALDEAILPGLEAHGIAAREAWRTRRLAT